MIRGDEIAYKSLYLNNEIDCIKTIIVVEQQKRGLMHSHTLFLIRFPKKNFIVYKNDIPNKKFNIKNDDLIHVFLMHFNNCAKQKNQKKTSRFINCVKITI